MRAGAIAQALALVALSAQDAELVPGVWVDATVAMDGPRIESNALRARGARSVPGTRLRLVPEIDGLHHVEAGSWEFGSHLILRDADGVVLAEVSNAPGLQPLVAADLRAGASYFVEVGTLAAEGGRFEVVCRAGPPGSRTAGERMARLEAEGRGESGMMAATLIEMAKGILQFGDYDRSAELMERALAIRIAYFGPDHYFVAATLEQTAWPLRRALRYDEALARLEAAADIWNRDPATGAEALTSIHHEVGRIHKDRGELEEALASYRLALATYDARVVVTGDDPVAHKFEGGIYNSLAVVLRMLGRWGEAREAYERALELIGDEPAVLTNFATLLAGQGDLARAREYFEKALDGLEARGLAVSPVAGQVWNDYGTFLLDKLGDRNEATAALNRALALRVQTLGPEHPHVGQTYNNLGIVLDRTGELERARGAFARGLELSERAMGVWHPATVLLRSNLAATMRKAGDLDEARALLHETIEVATRTVGADHPDTVAARFQLGLVQWAGGAHEAALETIEGAHAATRRLIGADHHEVAHDAAVRAQLLLQLGRPREAWDELEPAILPVHDRMQRELMLLDDGERLLFASRIGFALGVLLSSAREIDDRAVRERAYAEVLAWKGRVSRSLMHSRARLEERLDEEGRRELGRLRVVQGELSRVLSAPPVDREERDVRLSDLRGERDRLVAGLSRRTGGGEAEPRPTLERLRAALPEGAAVVDLLVHRWWELPGEDDGPSLGRWGESRVVAWIVRAEAELVQLDLGPAAVLSTAIEALRGALAQSTGRGMGMAPDGERDVEPALSRRVRELLWDPIAPHVVGADPVILCPDAFLATLPFGVLRREDGTHLIEHHRFAYLQDAAWIERMSEPEERDVAPSLLVVGDVDYGDRGEAPSERGRRDVALLRGDGSTWEPLPFTAVEIAAVEAERAAVFGPEAPRLRLAGADASEERIEAELPGRTVVHLATHGFFDPTGGVGLGASSVAHEAGLPNDFANVASSLPPGLLSGLVCAGASGPSEPDRADGILTAEELSWLDLSSADLVVLSACETGLGRAASGEGLMGLRRTFRMCGARTVISSLWSVPDESTANLMAGFYRRLWRNKESSLNALRRAQLQLLKNNREATGRALPGTWAAFVLDGDWR